MIKEVAAKAKPEYHPDDPRSWKIDHIHKSDTMNGKHLYNIVDPTGFMVDAVDTRQQAKDYIANATQRFLKKHVASNKRVATMIRQTSIRVKPAVKANVSVAAEGRTPTYKDTTAQAAIRARRLAQQKIYVIELLKVIKPYAKANNMQVKQNSVSLTGKKQLQYEIWPEDRQVILCFTFASIKSSSLDMATPWPLVSARFYRMSNIEDRGGRGATYSGVFDSLDTLLQVRSYGKRIDGVFARLRASMNEPDIIGHD